MQELEKSLKTTCEEFIMSVTKLVVEPLLSFVTKVSSVFHFHLLLFSLFVGAIFQHFQEELGVDRVEGNIVVYGRKNREREKEKEG